VLVDRRAEHYEFLIAHRSDIVFGGPARAVASGPPEEMVIVVDVADLDAAQAFLDAEPYHREGVFSRVSVRPWTQVLPERTAGELQRTLDSERA
jgi:uncharacterized protein YciI